MLKKTYFNIFFIFITIFFLIGCTSIPFFNEPKLVLYSSEIIDDYGFPCIYLKFNLSHKTTLKLYDPNGKTLFSDEYYPGNHDISIPMDDYRNTPLSGTYEIKAFDDSGNLFYNKKMYFDKYNLTITGIVKNWWKNNDIDYLLGLELYLKNTGDLPAYPKEVNVQIDDKNSYGSIIPKVVLPNQNEKLYSYIYFDDISVDSSIIKLTFYDSKGLVKTDSTKATYSNFSFSNLEYNWNFNGPNRLIIPKIDFLYDFYIDQDRILLEDYTAYIYDNFDDKYIDLVVERLLSLTDFKKDVSLINFAASFIQSLQYVEDDENNQSCEYPRFPVEMLTDSKGDCEDKAILTANILDNMGYNVSLIRLPNHMAVGVHLNEDLPLYDYYIDQYYYLETTRSRWNLGKIPEEYKDLTNVTVYPLSSHFILFHDWINATRFSTTDSSDFVKLKVIVENFGSKTANNFEISGAFFDKNDKKFNEQIITISSLRPGEKKLYTFKIDIPLDFPTTLKTQILYDDKIVNEKVSASEFP